MGLAMGVLAFAIEKAVLRSIRKGGAKQAPSEPREPFATSKGTDVTGG